MNTSTSNLVCSIHSKQIEGYCKDCQSYLCAGCMFGTKNVHKSHDLISLDELASTVGFSKFYFAREFKRITGYTFVAYLNLVRCKKAKNPLTETQQSIGEISRLCGYENQSYFSRAFLRRTGMIPSEYREKKNKNKG